MATDLTVVLEDKPGTFAKLGEALGEAGVNIDGIAAVTAEGKGHIHILVEDGAKAHEALRAAGIDVQAQRDVLVLELVNKPGMLGALTRKMADAGVNIELIYIASNTRIVLAADDLEKAAAAI